MPPVVTLSAVRRCFDQGRVLYSSHARREMRTEERGPIMEAEVYEAVAGGEIIQRYPDDRPYPSALISGRAEKDRPIHAVCAYSAHDDLAIIVTVYEPDPDRWIDDFRQRKPT